MTKGLKKKNELQKENEWEGRVKPCHANKSQPLCLSRSQNQIWDAVTTKQGTRNVGERWTSCLRSSEVLATGGVKWRLRGQKSGLEGNVFLLGGVMTGW